MARWLENIYVGFGRRLNDFSAWLITLRRRITGKRLPSCSDSVLLPLAPSKAAFIGAVSPPTLQPLLRPWPCGLILFADLHQYTRLNTILGDMACTRLLHKFYRHCYLLALKYHIHLLKTNADEVIALTGLGRQSSHKSYAQGARQLSLFACHLVQLVAALSAPKAAPLTIRIGIAAGPVVAQYPIAKAAPADIFGQTVITAARLQRSSQPGQPAICATTAQLLLTLPAPVPAIRKPGSADHWILLPLSGNNRYTGRF